MSDLRDFTDKNRSLQDTISDSDGEVVLNDSLSE